MRKGLLALALLAFVLFLPWKAVPFLRVAQPDVAATPIPLAGDPSELATVAVPRGATACVDHITYGPDARYVALTLQGTRPAGAVAVVARAPGYTARAVLPAGQAPGTQAVVPIAPARADVAAGTLCVTNRGHRQLDLAGVNPATRAGSPAVTTIRGRRVGAQLSVTLLRSPSRSLWAQLGEIFHRVAAFRPIGAWFAALLFGLLFLAAPIALAVALARAGGVDDAAERMAERGRHGDRRGGW